MFSVDEGRLEDRLPDHVRLRLGYRLRYGHVQLLGGRGREPRLIEQVYT
jgi:hypothetical protein